MGPTQNHTIVHLYRNHRKEKKKGKKISEEERGRKWIQREQIPLIIQIAAWCLNPPLQHPHQTKSINQLEISENNQGPFGCGRYTLESRCGRAARDSQSAMGKNNKNSTRGIRAKNICNQETSPIYQTFAADPHHYCITGNSQVSYELHLALPFLGLAQTAESQQNS